MTQPQVLQSRQVIAAQSMSAACGEVYDLAARLQQTRWDLPADLATVRGWADQLATAARQMEELARFREGLGE